MESESMEYRNLGSGGLKVSVLGFGNMVSKTLEDEQWSFSCIDKCIRAGVNFFDTAEVYAQGWSEKILGMNLKTGGWDRDDLIISTKLMPSAGGMMGNSRKRMKAGLEKSLARLQLDNADILFLHRIDYGVPLEEQVRTMNQFIEDEKAYYWGTSEFNAPEIMEIYRICEKFGLIPPIVDQCEYNMLARDKVEVEYAPLFDQYRMGTTIWSPLSFGLLSGKYNSGEAPEGSRFFNTAFPIVQRRWNKWMVEKKDTTIPALQKLGELSTELGCSQAQLALAWAIKNPDVSTCLLGASQPEQLDDTLQAVEVAKKLTPEVLARIEESLGNRPSPSMNWRYFTPNPPRR